MQYEDHSWKSWAKSSLSLWYETRAFQNRHLSDRKPDSICSVSLNVLIIYTIKTNFKNSCLGFFSCFPGFYYGWFTLNAYEKNL